MSGNQVRILITGFGPFPGAPYNPTPALVQRLVALRRPAFGDVERIGHVFPVSYSAVDRQLPQLLAKHRPDALLMFGLATRTRFLRVETRARNAVTMLWPDVEHAKVLKSSIVPDDDALSFGPHSAKLLRAAACTGIDARSSRDAGSYLCNHLSFRAIEAAQKDGKPRLASFVHVPLVPREGVSRRPGQITAEQLVDAGEAMLLELLRLTRQAQRAG
jgi:pyroglutamyl-peptidase